MVPWRFNSMFLHRGRDNGRWIGLHGVSEPASSAAFGCGWRITLRLSAQRVPPPVAIPYSLTRPEPMRSRPSP
jgi:hypothetical protein